MVKKRKLYGQTRKIPVLESSLQTLSWLRRGKIREFVFLHIGDKTMPSDIVKELAKKSGRKSGSHYAQVSRAIAELEKQSLIKCLNPKEKTGRFYQLTSKGLKIKKI